LPAHELYYEALLATWSEATLDDARPRLLCLLAETVAQHRTREAQDQCSAFALALVAGDADAILASARKLAAGEAQLAG
jgi:O-succinylbenzoate synthase